MSESPSSKSLATARLVLPEAAAAENIAGTYNVARMNGRAAILNAAEIIDHAYSVKPKKK